MKRKNFFNMVNNHHRLFSLIGIIILLIAVMVFVYRAKKKSVFPQQNLVAAVNIASVKPVKNVKKLSAIGTVKAAQGIQVSSGTAGIISMINFHSGETVPAGKILVILQNDALKATVQEDRVKYQLAKLNEDRLQKLLGKGYVSPQDAGQAASHAKQAKAQLAHDQALLQETIIKTPFPGRLGIRQISVGGYVSAGQVIVSLQDRRKMVVDFSIPQKQSDLLHVGDRVLVSNHQSQAQQWQGRVIALGAQMDNDTRSLPVRAALNPPYANLVPGMYVTVSVVLPTASNKPAVPQSAIVYNPYGNFVYLYQNGKVIQRHVTLGAKVDELVVVTKGLMLGDQVVVAGQQKLFNGAQVNVVEE